MIYERMLVGNSPKDDSKINILLVDDIAANLVALEALIKRPEIKIFRASSGMDALELLLQFDFALALLDVQMPVMNGFELAEHMRSTSRTRHIPIIFVTAGAKDQNFTFRGYESGAVDFLFKPLDTTAVKSKVSVFIDLYRQRKRLDEQLAELKEVKDKLESAVRIRDEFMSIASHELKTPLTALKLQSHIRNRNLLIGNTTAFTEARLKKMFETDRQQVERLERLIDDMLDISKINLGKLELEREEFDISQSVVETVEQFRDQLDAAGCDVALNIQGNWVGNWDRFRIEQVLINLLTNAIRYGNGKPVQVSVERVADDIRIKVVDKGRGIAKENHKRIFERFERAVSVQEVSGMGLGLFIAAQILEAHDGAISVESELGQGATFTIRLPLNVPSVAPALQKESKTPGPQSILPSVG